MYKLHIDFKFAALMTARHPLKYTYFYGFRRGQSPAPYEVWLKTFNNFNYYNNIMSNLYILSNQLCNFCNIPHGSILHMKHIIRHIENYILSNIHIKGELPVFNNNLKVMYFDHKLQSIFSNIPKDDFVINSIIDYCNSLDISYNNYSIFTHNFNDIDVYLELSGHIKPIINIEIKNILNNISSHIDNLILSYITDDSHNENLLEVQHLLNELNDFFDFK